MNRKKYKEMISSLIGDYLRSKEKLQEVLQRNKEIKGKCGDFIIQSSHGGMQVKRYEPQKYNTDVITPLRQRSHNIFKLANQHSSPSRLQALRYLYRTYPYYLLVTRAVHLSLKNFYFDTEPQKDDIIKIYQQKSKEDRYYGVNEQIAAVKYHPKKTLKFEYRGVREEFYYGVNERTSEMSNVVHFMWE